MYARMDSQKSIIDDSLLPSGSFVKATQFARESKHFRQVAMKQDVDAQPSEDAYICAAIEIQRVYRGYSFRCRLLSTLYPSMSKTALFGDSSHHLARLADVRTPSPALALRHSASDRNGTKSIARLRLEQRYKNYVTKLTEVGDTNIKDFQEFCAFYIGEWWRGKHGEYVGPLRNETKISVVEETEPEVKGKPKVKQTKQSMQKMKPEPKMRAKAKRTSPPTAIEAATIIQRAWRKHIDVQVYRYYRDLINFKNRGDPAMMLRCINPNEAKYLDAACGVHIKFRLAGERFPPNIYYKIFTHRPIQDLCANSPKDYTKPDTKLLMARDVHNKAKRVPVKDSSGWYHRSENNGWRLVSDRLIHHIMSDPVTWETSNKKVDFHHDKLQRKVDVEKKKKQKKIDWMKKMYHEGMLQAKVSDPDTVDLINGAAAGMVATIDMHGPEAVQDWEVDELLDWTTSLNFEDYWIGWKEAGTSAVSEAPIDDRSRLATTQSDPFELTVSKNGHLPDASTRQSHNTPVSHSTHSVASY